MGEDNTIYCGGCGWKGSAVVLWGYKKIVEGNKEKFHCPHCDTLLLVRENGETNVAKNATQVIKKRN